MSYWGTCLSTRLSLSAKSHRICHFLLMSLMLSSQQSSTLPRYECHYYWGIKRSLASVCVCVCMCVWQNQNGWNYNHQTCYSDTPSGVIIITCFIRCWVLATHLILGPKVKGYGLQSVKKTYFSWRQSSGRCELALYQVAILELLLA